MSLSCSAGLRRFVFDRLASELGVSAALDGQLGVFSRQGSKGLTSGRLG